MGDLGSSKLALGAAAGAMGGALSEDPDKLTSFIGQTGQSQIPGGGTMSVDPGDSMATGLDLSNRGFRALSELASTPVDLGPQSMVQTPGFAFGGSLPAPLGFTVTDPGWRTGPRVDFSTGSTVGPQGPGDQGWGVGDDWHGIQKPLGGFYTDEEVETQTFPGHPDWGKSTTPSEPVDRRGGDGGGGGGGGGGRGEMSRFANPFGGFQSSRFGLPSGGAQGGGFKNFQTAMNLLRQNAGKSPLASGGFGNNAN
jgi:hypothetical protein